MVGEAAALVVAGVLPAPPASAHADLPRRARARARARGLGISLVRVDCWAGGDGSLIRYYEGQGFTPTVRVPVSDTEVQMFEDRV